MSIQVTDSAVSKVTALIQEEANPALKLRIAVQGGGCAGFKYDFSFDEEVQEDDFVIEKDSIQILVDALSNQYLNSAELDYQEDLNGARFIIRNPNAKTTCGCGSSFSVQEESEEEASEKEAS